MSCDSDEMSLPEDRMSLVKYNSPELIPSHISFGSRDEQLLTQQDPQSYLDKILPPLEWESHGKRWRQSVSRVPASRNDAIRLHELLDRRLKEQRARELGICHVRRELYTQFFDELIRQVAVDSSERGFLVHQIKQEFIKTISEYESIYKSAVTYGIRKRLIFETSKDEYELKLYEFPQQMDEIRIDITSLKHKIAKVKEDGMRAREILMETRAEEIVAMKAANDILKAQIMTLLFPRNLGI